MRPILAHAGRRRFDGHGQNRLTSLVLCVAVAVGSAAACSSGGPKGSSAPGKDSLAVEVASYDLAVGPPARFIAGVLTAGQQLVGFGTVSMRFAFLGTKEASASSTPVGSPTIATFLPVPGTTVPSPPPAAPGIVAGVDRGVYGAQFAFDRPGFWQVEVTARIAGTQRRGTSAFAVGDHHHLPAVGDAALNTNNLTMASTDVPKAAIDSRAGTGGEVPDPELHSTTIAAALAAKRPAVVVFATPVYCVSRFCGPVTDLVDGLSKTNADRASFIHVEIFKNFEAQNDAERLNAAAAEWLLRDDDLNEPWVFVIGADGRIIARFDNVVTAAELEALLQTFPVIGPAA
ncbi:MAG: hypothetical protein M3011_14100 [Actinomycetota bacterium]|nr:hypothetical protein [Actinomycetota bacterium]